VARVKRKERAQAEEGGDLGGRDVLLEAEKPSTNEPACSREPPTPDGRENGRPPSKQRKMTWQRDGDGDCTLGESVLQERGRLESVNS